MRNIYILFIIIINVGCSKIDLERTTLLSKTEANWSTNSLSVKSAIIDKGSNSIEQYGFVYAINHEPFVGSDSMIILGSTDNTTAFDTRIANVIPASNYYIKGFAKSGNTIYYSNIASVYTRLDNLTIRCKQNTVSTKKVDLQGIITNKGTLSIKEYGHCWSYQPTNKPTLSNFVRAAHDINAYGEYTNSIDNPVIDSLGYVRSYLILSDGQVIYSDTIYAFLVSTYKLWVTDAFIDLNNLLQVKGIFERLGTDPLTEYGICWSNTTPIPTINDEKYIISTPPVVNSVFTAIMPKPSAQNPTDYYFRAYAIVENKVVYSSNVLKRQY